MEYQPAEPGSPWDGPEPEEPTDAELFGLWPDPFAGPPEDADAWLGDRAGVGLGVVARSWAAAHPADLGQAGFESGGPLDVLPPDPVLAFVAAGAYDGGLDGLTDDALVGLLGAARRLSSWQAAVELDVVAELDRRRAAAGSSRAAEQVSAELAAALTLTGRSADALLCLARDLGRLPAARAGLLSGQIDRAKAGVFAAELAAVSDTVAATIAMALVRAAAGMTTGQLRAELRALVLAVEPDALRRRAERGQAEARVETWQEGSGNWGIAGRELPAADAITADQRLTAIARALKDAGASGTMDQLRVAVFVALLTGRDPQTLLPEPARTQHQPAAPAARPGGCGCGCGCPGGIAALTGSINLTMPLATWLGTADRPGEVAGLGPVDAKTCRDLAGRLAAGPSATWCLTLTDADRRAVAHACAKNGPAQPPAARSRSPGGDHRLRPSGGPGPPGNPRSSDASGPSADARGPRQPPGPPRPPEPLALAAWLTSLEMQWLERGNCGHRRQGTSYRPSRTLRHLIQIRHRTCAHPGCRRPAQDCDLDHTIPYDQGGRTCECNCGPSSK
jgi:hypothetical protein